MEAAGVRAQTAAVGPRWRVVPPAVHYPSLGAHPVMVSEVAVAAAAAAAGEVAPVARPGARGAQTPALMRPAAGSVAVEVLGRGIPRSSPPGQ